MSFFVRRFLHCRSWCVSPGRVRSAGSRYLAGTSEHSELKNNIIKSSQNISLVEDKSFPKFLLERFHSFENKSAIIDSTTGNQYTYTELADLAVKFGSGLAKQGFKKGDVFVIYSPNIAEFPIISLAVMSLGGIVLPVNPSYTVHELCYQINDTKAKFIAGNPETISNAKQAAKHCGMKDVLVIGQAKDCTPFSEFVLSGGSGFSSVVKIDPKADVGAILYSSGTSGLPKGVMMTHFTLVTDLLQASSSDIPAREKEHVVLAIPPFHHIIGFQFVLHISLYRGASIVLLPKFEPKSFLNAIQKYKVSRMTLVPHLVSFLDGSPLVDQYDLSSLNFILYGGASSSPSLATSVRNRLSSLKQIKTGYGMTEIGTISSYLVNGTEASKLGSVGFLVPNTEAKIVDLETNEILGPNEPGEIYIKGPQVTKGYWNNPEANNEAFTSDGWFRTGDVGYYDSDHCFYIIDRCKELIKYKGYQVAPAELEAVLTSHPKIQDAAVIGIPAEEYGEVAKAFIVASSADLTEKEIYEYLESRMAPHKKLYGGLEFISEIPRTTSGKIMRRVLRDKAK